MSDAPVNEGFRRMVDSTFYVKLKIQVPIEGGGTREEEANVKCREMPLQTLSYVVTEVFRLASENAMVHGGLMGKYFNEVVDAEDDAERRRATGRLFSALLPMLLDVLPKTPQLLERVFVDCIIGSDPDSVRRIGFGHGVAILNGLLQHMDTEDTRRHVMGFIKAIGAMIAQEPKAAAKETQA